MRRGFIGMALAVAAPSAAQAQAAPAAAPPPQKPGSVSEVVVSGHVAPVQTAIDRRSYSVTGDLQAQTGSIGDALRNIPSVEVDVQGNVSLRGDSNVTILIDGRPSALFQGDNKAQALQQLPADQVERVEVIPNPSAEFRADGSAGVINLITRKARGAGRTGGARLTLGSGERAIASASTGYNSPRLTVTGDLNYRHDPQKQAVSDARLRLDPLLGGFDGTRQDQLVHLRLDSLSAHGAADYDLDPRTRIGGEARLNYVDFLADIRSQVALANPDGDALGGFDRGLEIHQKRANGEVAASLRRKLGAPGEELSLNLSYELTHDDRVRSGRTLDQVPPAPDGLDQQRLNYDLRRTELKGDYVRPLEGGVTLKAGFDLQYDDNGYDNQGFRAVAPAALAPDPSLSNLFLYRQTLAQAYATYERPFGALTVLAGLRLEDLGLDLDQVTQGRRDHGGYARAYPSLHLAWTLSDSQQLTAAYSHRVQRPDPLDFNAFRFLLDPLNYRQGNPNLQPQQTHAFELGYQYRHGPSLYLATLYYRENLNGVGDVVSDLGGGVFLTTRENIADSRNAGLELVANGRLTRALTYNLSANAYWNELDAVPLGPPQDRAIVTGSARASLTWQATPKDLVQLSGFMNGRRLTIQGYNAPTGALNLGYRHKLSDRLSLQVSAQDLLGTFHDHQVIDTPTLKSQLIRHTDSRILFAGFVWTFGGGRSKDQGFEFQQGGGASPQ